MVIALFLYGLVIIIVRLVQNVKGTKLLQTLASSNSIYNFSISLVILRLNRWWLDCLIFCIAVATLAWDIAIVCLLAVTTVSAINNTIEHNCSRLFTYMRFVVLFCSTVLHSRSATRRSLRVTSSKRNCSCCQDKTLVFHSSSQNCPDRHSAVTIVHLNSQGFFLVCCSLCTEPTRTNNCSTTLTTNTTRGLTEEGQFAGKFGRKTCENFKTNCEGLKCADALW